MAILPSEDEYQQRVNGAWLSHVAKGLRGELTDDGIPDDANDEDVVRFYRETYAPESDSPEFQNFLDDTYSKSFKSPNPTLGERGGALVRGVAHAAPSMAQQVVGQTGAEMMTGLVKNIPAKIGKGARIVGAPILGGAYLARMLAQIHTGDELAQIAGHMSAPDMNMLQKHYFESLGPSLEAKGYTPDQVIEEVQKRVRNVVRGYTMTQNSLMGDIENTSEDVISSAAEGIANVGLLGVGGGFFKNALLAGARRAGGVRAAEAVTSTLAGRLITHAGTGAALGGAYGATIGGIERGAHAAVEGKSVPGATTEGIISGGLGGAAAGALIGGPLGAGLDAIGNKAVVDAAMQTPKPSVPLVEIAVGKVMPQSPFEIAGAAPTTMEHPVGSQAWWDQFHGMKQPEEHLQSPLGTEGAKPTVAPEIAPRFTEPGMQPVMGGEPSQPAGSTEAIEMPQLLTRPAPNPELSALRAAAVEPRSISLPTEEVETLTKAVMANGSKLEGAQVNVRPSVDGRHIVIDSLKGAEHGAGNSKKALARITASADEAGVPLDVTVNSYKGPRGGTIPAEKIAQWYEKQGFIRTTTSEGSISLRRPVPEAAPPLSPQQVNGLMEHHLGLPSGEDQATLDSFLQRVSGLPENKAAEALGNIEEGRPMILGGPAGGQPSAGMRLGGWLDTQASAADARIKTKLGRLNTGFDPSLIGDYAIKAAAKMYRLGLTAFRALRAEMLKEHPGIPAPAMKDIIEQARTIISNRLGGDTVSVTTLRRLLEAAEEGRPGADWYDKTASAVEKMFGRDSDMFLRFLAATSAGKAADSNVTLTMKAYGQWKLGLPFDGYIGNDKLHLERAVRGEVFGERKLQSILAALRGDENAVAIDRHVMRSLGFSKAGAEKGSMTDREYDFFEAVIRDLARARGMTPRKFQASLWTSAKIRQAQTATNAREMGYLHTFRPYEGILKHEYDIHEAGKTPVDWVNENRVTLRNLANAAEGVQKTRAGGGHTYNPYDYSAYEGDKGLVTTLASIKIPTNRLSASEVIGFANKWKDLFDTYHGMNVGTFNLDQAGEPGMTSIDVNVVLPEEMRAAALALGKSRRQHSLWDLSKSEAVETGFKGETMGAPTDPKERGQWWKKQREEIKGILENLGVPSKAAQQTRLELPVGTDDLMFTREQAEPMIQKPHDWASIASDMLGIPQDQIKPLVDAGKVHPVSDAGLLDHVVVNKDGLVWEFVDPASPAYNIMKLVGNLRGKRAAETLVYLEGKNILQGHDVVQDYRSQAGFARVSSVPKLVELARRAPVAKINAALLKTGGKVVKANDFRFSRPQGISLWISPRGQVIQVPYHLTSADKAIKSLHLKNPVLYEGLEHSELQTMLNHGYVRVQLHEQSYAADSSLPLTAEQVVALRELRRSEAGQRQFAGRRMSPSGQQKSMHDDWSEGGNGALNKYIVESRGEE